MRFVTVRDLRTRPAQIWRKLRGEKELILTSNGKPIAILAAVSGDTLEELLNTLRRARAMMAVSSMQERSLESGVDSISHGEIDKEIADYRKSRKKLK